MYDVDARFDIDYPASILLHFHLNRHSGERMDRKCF
jgi:hypothetical protein